MPIGKATLATFVSGTPVKGRITTIAVDSNCRLVLGARAEELGSTLWTPRQTTRELLDAFEVDDTSGLRGKPLDMRATRTDLATGCRVIGPWRDPRE